MSSTHHTYLNELAEDLQVKLPIQMDVWPLSVNLFRAEALGNYGQGKTPQEAVKKLQSHIATNFRTIHGDPALWNRSVLRDDRERFERHVTFVGGTCVGHAK